MKKNVILTVQVTAGSASAQREKIVMWENSYGITLCQYQDISYLIPASPVRRSHGAHLVGTDLINALL